MHVSMHSPFHGADSQDPQLSSHRRPFQTSQTPEKLAHMFQIPWSVLRNGNDERNQKNTRPFGVARSGSLGPVVRTWKHERGQDTRDNRRVRLQRDAEIWVQVAIYFGTQRGRHSAQLQAVLARPLRRLFRRSTRSSGAGSGSICFVASGQWRAARGPLQRPRGNRSCCVRAIDPIRCSRPGFVTQDRSCAKRPRVAPACVWMQLLKLRKTATSHGCKKDVL